MSLKEAKDLSNPNSVHFFKDSEFCKLESKEKWDRIKLVCSQPYNKHVQFGLSFIKFHGDSEDTATTSGNSDSKIGALGKFLLKEDNEDDIVAGSIFARRKELQDQEKPKTSAVAIRAATSELKNGESSQKPVTPKNSAKNQGNNTVGAKRNQPASDPSITPKQKKVKKEPSNDDDSGPSFSIDPKPKTRKTPTSIPSSQPPSKKRIYKPFRELMKGVIFTISGFQNPLRGDVRNKGMDMGARYVPDWNNSCTHLICAFPNTPKFNQVKGHGKIVKKDWIEESYSKRIRFPWRRYALDPPDAKQTESEDEIYEGDEKSVNGTPAGPSSTGKKTNQPGPSLFGDLPNDAAKKPKTPAKEKKQPAPKKTSPKKKQVQKKESTLQLDDGASSSNGITFNDAPANQALKKKTIYLDLNLEDVESRANSDLGDTDADSDWVDDDRTDSDKASVSSCALPYLPEQFSDLSFYVADDFLPSVRTDIKRYLIAHSGSVLESCTEDTEYVIAGSSATVNKLKEEYPNIVGVKSEWVWRCHDENRLLPTSNFEI